MRSSKVMKDDVKMVQDPPRVDVDASVINRSMLVFISMCKFLTKCNATSDLIILGYPAHTWVRALYHQIH